MTLVALASGRAVRALRPLARARQPLRAATALRSTATRPAFLDAKEPLPASYDFGVEGPLYEWWEASGKFKPKEEEHDRGAYTCPMPPPNVTGRLHLGHAMFVALQDILARFHRMRGRPTLW